MKHITRILLPSLLASALFCSAAHAAVISPGISLIAAKNNMIKTGNSYAGVTFSAEDFRNATARSEVESITITSLPAVSSGVLYLGNVPLAVNQSVSGGSLNNLKFIPADGSESGSFSFTAGGGYSVTCEMHITDKVNFSPVAGTAEENCAAWTQKDISCFGTLEAYDPEGDPLRFEIVRYPAKGLLTLQNESHGDFCYTPYVGCSGEDSFTYRVQDSYGNYSEEVVKTVTISRQNSKLVFADMNEHWAHSAAIEMVSSGIMDYSTETGMAVFHPEETVSREEFLVMVMKSLGFENKSAPVSTVFADDAAITPENKAYISAAYNAGIIHGRNIDGKMCFCPDDPISRSEAAVMMNNIIGAEVPVNVSLFADNASVPTWAQSALYALHDLHILRGTGSGVISPYSVITRAQAAQILLNFTQYLG